jgi:putative transposase
MTRSRYRYGTAGAPHFLTGSVVGWLAAFSRPEIVQIVLDSWQFLANKQRIVLYGYVVLENHVHWIASSDDLSKEVGDFKSFTARKIIDFLAARGEKGLLAQLEMYRARHKTDRDYQFWQEGNHPQEISNDDMMRQKLEYAHLNPVKRGYVRRGDSLAVFQRTQL